MRELVHSVRTNKPLIAVAERDEENHGGLSEAEARQRCVASGGKFASWDYFGLKAREVPAPAALADALLGPTHALFAPYKVTTLADDGKPIVYERVGAFQQTMLRLIVQRLAPQRQMYLPGELGTGHIQPLPPPKKRFHIWCSRHNPGVRELIEEVPRSPRVVVFSLSLLTPCVPPIPQMQTWWAPGPPMKVTDDPDAMEEADQVLLYLNLATWADDDAGRRDALTEEVRALLQPSQQGLQPSRVSRISLGGGVIDSISPRQPLLLVHEVDEQRGGFAEFGYLFGAGVTPPELLKLKIYAEIAIPMKAGEYRSVSRGLLDRALRAEQSSSDAPWLRRLVDLHLLPLAQRLMLPNRGVSGHVAAPSRLCRAQLGTGEDTLSAASPPGATTFTPLDCSGNAASESVPRKRPVSAVENKLAPAQHTLAPRGKSLKGTNSDGWTQSRPSMLQPPAMGTGNRRPSMLPPPASGAGDASLPGTDMSSDGRWTRSRLSMPPPLATGTGACGGSNSSSLSDVGSSVWSPRASVLPPLDVRGTASTFPTAPGCSRSEFKQERVDKPQISFDC